MYANELPQPLLPQEQALLEAAASPQGVTVSGELERAADSLVAANLVTVVDVSQRRLRATELGLRALGQGGAPRHPHTAQPPGH